MMQISLSDFRTLLVAVTLFHVTGCAVHPASAEVDVAGGVAMGDEHTRVEILFSSDDRRHIHDYYYREHEHHRARKRFPPGLAKRDELPPGLQEQIRRNGRLPPGLRVHRLPDELERRLSPLPDHYMRLQVGRDIILMDERTRITVDVIKNIYP